MNRVDIWCYRCDLGIQQFDNLCEDCWYFFLAIEEERE